MRNFQDLPERIWIAGRVLRRTEKAFRIRCQIGGLAYWVPKDCIFHNHATFIEGVRLFVIHKHFSNLENFKALDFETEVQRLLKNDAA